MPLATTIEPKVKTFTRARAIEVIRNQYRHMKSSERTMKECLEMMKKADERDIYQKSFYESFGRYQTANSMIESLCEGFGIQLVEIDPTIHVAI